MSQPAEILSGSFMMFDGVFVGQTGDVDYIYILIRQVFVIDNFAYLRLNHDFQCTKIADLGYFW